MKKYLVAGLLLVLLNSCDDGDLVYEDLDFESTTMNVCNNTVLYKINDDKAFIINVPDVQAILPNEPTGENPLPIAITGTTRVVYRHYNGNVEAENICAAIPPATPVVDDEWTATEGNIIITSSAINVANTDVGFEGGQKITTLEHVIRLQNVTFQTGSGTQTYSVFPEDGSAFGIYDEAFVMPEIPDANSTLQYCENEKMVFVRNPSNLFSLKISDALLDSSVINEVKTGYLDGTNNDLFFKSFPSLSLDSVAAIPEGCANLFASVPLQQWNAVYGIEADMSGQIQVTTTNDVSGFVKHNIHLKNVTLKFGTITFLLATDYFLGELILPI